MPRYTKRAFQIGDYWLDRRPNSPAWCRCWYDSKARQVRWQSLKTPNLQAATEELVDWYHRHVHRQESLPQEVPVVEVLWRYYEEHAKELPSWDSALYTCKLFVKFFADDNVSGLTVRRQEDYIRWRREAGVTDGTIGRELSVLRAAVNRGFRRQELVAVPVIQGLPRGESRKRRLSKAEMAELLLAASHVSDHLLRFVLLAANTLSRPEAVLDLTVFQLDYEHRLIALNPAGRRQTKKHRPVVPMTDTIEPVLRTARGSHVVAYRGGRVQSVKKAFRRARQLLGLDLDVIPYTIRHTMATELRKRGVPKWEVEGWLGHKAGDPTEAYAIYDPDYLSAGRRAIDAYFRELAFEFRLSRGSGALAKYLKTWSGREDLNLRPPRPERGALPG